MVWNTCVFGIFWWGWVGGNPPTRAEVDWETTLQMDEKRTLYSDISKYMRTCHFKQLLQVKTRKDCYEFVMLFEFISLSVLRLLLDGNWVEGSSIKTTVTFTIPKVLQELRQEARGLSIFEDVPPPVAEHLWQRWRVQYSVESVHMMIQCDAVTWRMWG